MGVPLRMDSRMSSIVKEMIKVESKGLNSYEIGSNYVMYFHTYQNKELTNVVKMIDKMIEPHLNSMIAVTSNEDTFNLIKGSIDNSKSKLDISESIVDVELTDYIYSTLDGSIDVMYGDLLWANMENGMSMVVFPSNEED